MGFELRSLFAIGSVGLLVSSTAIVACSKDKSAGSAAASGAPPSGATPLSSALGAPAAPPMCVADPEKVWAADASTAAGISQTDLDAGRVAFGVVLGGTPEVLVFDAKGEGEQKHVRVKKALTDAIPEGTGRREIHRVTPAVGSGGEILAYVDFEQIGNAHRTVACGRSDSNDELLKFDGKPLVSVAEDHPDGKAGNREAEKPTASAPPAAGKAAASGAAATGSGPPQDKVKSAFSGRRVTATPLADLSRLNERMQERVRVARTEPPRPSAVPAAAPAIPSARPTEKSSKPKGESSRELRDCRTFVDRGGAHAWSAGSELVGQPQEDGSTEWSMEFLAEQDQGRGKVVLSASPLGKAPTKLPVYESPTALDLGNGEFALSTRYRGSLFAWLLDASKHLRGPTRIFSGGFPSAPRFASFGVDRTLLVVARDAGDVAVPRALRFDPSAPQLPAMLTDFSLGGLSLVGSMSGAMLGAQRFIAVQSAEIERDVQSGPSARHLTLLPVDPVLSSLNRPILVDTGVSESRLIPLVDGRLLLVYLRSSTSGHVELVSRSVKCG